ncbi:MAG: SAM-dependent methyltransferase [Acidimicrobiales bacterium]
MGELERLLVSHIAEAGPIGFDELQAHALYAPGHGFYATGGGAGRRRDFLTSPEVGPLFGAVIANALDAWWGELGRPEHLPVVEAGAGPGTLARAILAAEPACGAALDLVLVEVGRPQWSTHPDGVRTVDELPGAGELGPGPVVVLANELLDNLPTAVAERTPGGWAEVVVDVVDGRLALGSRPLEVPQQRWCEERAPEAAVGARIPVQAEAAGWLADALVLAAGGRVVVIDYARTTAEMSEAGWEAWLRTYARHGRAAGPLEDLGGCDITADVAIDQLALVRPPDSVRSQADFLRAHGIDALVAEGDERWARDGLAGGLDAIAGRSRRTEAAALLDPAGLGGFTVAEWVG